MIRAASTQASSIRVYETVKQLHERESRAAEEGKPAHWVYQTPTLFANPWSSWIPFSKIELAQMGLKLLVLDPPIIPSNVEELIPVRKPTWGLDKADDRPNESIKVTWLGHACILVELPKRDASRPRGTRILFDPVFRDRCSPSQYLGPKRFTQTPCEIDAIPELDAIVISHNHYDHLDTHTIRTLFKRERLPHIFAPLGNARYFRSLGIPESHTHILDWWESRRVEVDLSSEESNAASKDAAAAAAKAVFEVTCTPAQHQTGRGICDQFKSLWASWVVEEVVDNSAPDARPGVKAYFAGDTGYRTVLDGQDEEKVPTCPAFKEIGERFGGFDLAMIPIGAYQPRWFMSRIHCAPQDSVRIFQDIRAKRALGMHWGTWALTAEDVLEPPKRLAEECQKLGIKEGLFSICDVGETVLF